MEISHRIKSFCTLSLYLSLAIAIAATLTTSDLFIYRSLTASCLYGLSIALFIILTGALFTMNKATRFDISFPIWVVLFWVMYVLIHGELYIKSLNPFHIYLVFNLIFLIALYSVVKCTKPGLITIFRIIVAIALIESMICMLQYARLLHSLNGFFAVTGTWENPNVTAMFITMAIPAAFSFYFQPEIFYKRAATIFILIFLITILLLQCRTALVGSFVALIILYNRKYSLIQQIKHSKNRSGKILLSLICLAITVFLGNYFYQAKKASADGRKLIWKLSAKMILEKPIHGYGYGLFARNYNLFQSQYFKTGDGNLAEIQQAGFVHMGYNEFLENTVEGGLPGLIIIIVFFGVLLVPRSFSKQNRNNETVISNLKAPIENLPVVAYSGIAAFAAMSVFNFTLQAIPAMCLFVIYVAIHSASPEYDYFRWKPLVIKPGFKWILSVCFIVVGVVFGIVTVNSLYTGLSTKRAQLLAQNKKWQQAIQVLNSLEKNNNLFEDYYITYGDILLSKKHYAAALEKYIKAMVYTSDPDVYIKAAFCYKQTGQYQDAEINYLVAKDIEPNRLKARMALMGMYLELKDTMKTIATAQEIITIRPKIYSDKVLYDQENASEILKRFGVSLHPNKLLLGSPISNYNLIR